MRGELIHQAPWQFSEAEREDHIWSPEGDPPKATDVIGEFGLHLAVALGFAMFVCWSLQLMGIPAP